MKRIIACGVFLAMALLFVVPRPAHAQLRGFGGTVLTSYIPGTSCAGEGPIFIIPKGTYPAGPYAVYPLTLRYANYVVKPGSTILGLYFPIPLPGICYTAVPPFTYPVFPIFSFGVSLY